MKFFTTLHILATVVLPARLEQARTESERGSEPLSVAVIAGIVLAVALALGGVLTAAVYSYMAQIHG